jgi:hypothetical protein
MDNLPFGPESGGDGQAFAKLKRRLQPMRSFGGSGCHIHLLSP